MPRKKPRKYKQPSLVSGMTVSDILNLPETVFNTFQEKQLKLVVGRLVSAINKRVRRFEKSGLNPPALQALKKSGGVLSVKGKNLNQLREEYARARNFLNMETSTQKGYRDVQDRIIETLEKRGVTVTRDEIDSMWEVWNSLTDVDPSIELSVNKYQLMQDIINMPDDIDLTEKVQQAKDRYTTLYEQQKREESNRAGVSQFFK